MESKDVSSFIAANQKFFPAEKLAVLREKLVSVSVSEFNLIKRKKYKNPSTMRLCAFFFGFIGGDRFMLGDTGMGMVKLLTGGLCGVLAIMDIFTISKRTKEFNFNSVMALI